MSDELTIQAKGGIARAEKLTAEQRTEIAQKAAGVRWGKRLRRAEFSGTLTIGDAVLPCAVLDDGTRVLTQGGFLLAIGRSRTPKAGTGVQKTGVDQTPTFLAANNLKPLLTPELVVSTVPMEYIEQNGIVTYGYKAVWRSFARRIRHQRRTMPNFSKMQSSPLS